MQTCNSNYFNAYGLLQKCLLLIICCFLAGCGKENNSKQNLSIENQIQVSESAININTASVSELEKLPNIGTKKANSIVEYREKFGRFRKPEHLLLVRGISENLYREIRSFIKVE